MNPPSTVLGGGVHGKVCWLIVYCVCVLNYQYNASTCITINCKSKRGIVRNALKQ